MGYQVHLEMLALEERKAAGNKEKRMSEEAGHSNGHIGK